MVDQNKRKRPKQYIDKAIEIFKYREGKVIVEIGCMRQPINHDINIDTFDCCNDGHSSLLFAKNCDQFFSVDINKDSCIITKKCLNDNELKNAKVFCGDGIEYLRQFDKTIDLLYLDAWDVGTMLYAEKHLDAYIVAKKLLHDNSLILIDDTDVYFDNGELFLSDNGYNGKAKLVIPEAIKDGYRVMFSERQTLLLK